MQRTQTPNPNANPLQSLEFSEGTDRAYAAVLRSYALRAYAERRQERRDALLEHASVGVRPADVFPAETRLALEGHAESYRATLPSFPSAKWGRPSPLESRGCEFLPKYAASFKAVDSGYFDESALAPAKTVILPTTTRAPYLREAYELREKLRSSTVPTGGIRCPPFRASEWLPIPLASRPSAPADRCDVPPKKRQRKWTGFAGQSRSTKKNPRTSRKTENFRKLEFRELMATIGIPLPPGIATSKK